MKVRVLKAMPTSWSYNHIGKEFEVDNHTNDLFYVLSADVEEDTKRLLSKTNCEIVENPGSSEMEHTDDSNRKNYYPMTSNKYIADLLKPRYKVIADWPGNTRYKIGGIVDFDKKDSEGYWTTKGYLQESFFSPYPHLFKKLQWWEDRTPEEMPEYVKCEDAGVYKVTYRMAKYRNRDIMRMHDGEGEWMVCPGVMEFYEPATETEYLDYINSKK